MKIIFLDVDGVLNPTSNIIKQYKLGNSTSSYHIKLDQECLNNLKYIVEQTGAKIIVSSSWRIGGYDKSPAIMNLARQLHAIDLDIYGFTPNLRNKNATRGDEVKTWLYTYNNSSRLNIESFVILDDDADLAEFTFTNLIKCRSEHGLIRECAELAVDLLNFNNYQRVGSN